MEGVREALPSKSVVKIEPELYGASADNLLHRLNKVPDSLRSVLLVNHNPAIEELAVGLCGDSNDPALQGMRTKYPTGGFAALTFDVTWPELSWGLATLEEFVVPRRLAARPKGGG
jgi:phosphohistidine phosphatase